MRKVTKKMIPTNHKSPEYVQWMANVWKKNSGYKETEGYLLRGVLDSLRNIEESSRKTGRTENIIKKARQNDLTVVCHNYSMCREVERLSGGSVKTITLVQYLDPNTHRGVTKRPSYIFDNMAEYDLILLKLKEAQRVMMGGVYE